MTRTKPWALLLAIVLAIGVSNSGCLFSPDEGTEPPPPQEEYLPRTSIGNVLENLQKAYRERNLDEYEKLFDQQVFIFKFSEIDVGGEEPLPPNWGWPEEQTSTRNMFEHELVTKVELDFTWETPRPVEESDEPPAESSMMTFLNSLELVVTADNPESGEVDRYVVEGDRHVFFFGQDANETQNNLPVWKIIEWRDEATNDGLLALNEPNGGAE